jgi:hypothetical protein
VSDSNSKCAPKRTSADRFHEFHARHGRVQLARSTPAAGGLPATPVHAAEKRDEAAIAQCEMDVDANQPSHDGTLRVANLGAVPD